MLINLMCFATLFSFQKHKTNVLRIKIKKYHLKKKDAKFITNEY